MVTSDTVEFGRLFERHYAAVFRYVVGRLGPDHGEEVSAQTFEVGRAQRARYDPARGEPLAWLLGVATNLVRRHRRTERRRWAAYTRIAGEPAPKESGIDDPAMAAFGSAVARLPRGERDVLLLAAWADLSYEQIAAALELPVGTVRFRLNRARQRIRATLESEQEAS